MSKVEVPIPSEHYGDRLPDFRRYRLQVASTTATDIVASVGGFILDTTWSGWETTIYAGRTDSFDDRALRVLGGRSAPLDDLLGAGNRDASPDVLAMSSDLYASDSRAWQWAKRVLRRGDVSLIIWGDHLRSDLPTMRTASHQCSSAAVAFKASALAALRGAKVAVEPFEPFGVNSTSWAERMRLWTTTEDVGQRKASANGS
jgi:hypothetical protein